MTRYVAIRSPLGSVQLLPLPVYAALPVAAVAHTRARLTTRRELVAERARVGKGVR